VSGAVLGVDGCKGGWIAARVEGTRIEWTLYDTAAEVVSDDAEVIAVDIPMGLPDAGVRSCDVAARRRLTGRASSVFAAPARSVLNAPSYAEARRCLADAGDASMSAQAFGIVAKVREWDEVLTPRLQSRVIEVHPEVSFAAMTGHALPRKKTAAGVGSRIVALGLDAAGHLAVAPPGIPVDDALDALACAWSARRWLRGEAEVLGGELDDGGLVMRIVV